MSDLLSPFVVLYEDDADAFWCFEMLMRRMMFNDKILQINVRRCISTAIKLQKKYLYKSSKARVGMELEWLIPSVRLRIESEKQKLKDVAQLTLKKMSFAEEETLSQSKYKRGVSTRNFEVEDLKAQASLVQDDDDEVPGLGEEDESNNLIHAWSMDMQLGFISTLKRKLMLSNFLEVQTVDMKPLIVALDVKCATVKANKPLWNVGSSFSIKKTTKSLPKVQIDDDLDLIDEDSLLTEKDLKKPQISIE
ncbi:hypothetical protein Syun_028079 [Stephania yunnanensis]|uniref:Uncharacterized protein n=1 Tax=Stephania yunnanensis TaxID=152371 RepID=A0AAP0EM96_9MAGN